MVKDAEDRRASGAGESSGVADGFGLLRSWDLGCFTFYPVGQASQTEVPERDGEKKRNQ